MIVVTGATGKVGSEAVRLLGGQRRPVRAFLRDPLRASTAWAPEVERAVGDLTDAASLDAALAGAEVLVLISPGLPGPEEIAIDAAVRAEVGHVVYLTSSSSPDSPIERRRWHHRVEQHLAASGLPHTLLKANAFMQNTLALAPAIRRTGGFRSSTREGRVGLVDARDVAAVAAAVAVEPGRAEPLLRLTGPAAITYREVADVLGDLLGAPVAYEPASFDEDVEAMVGAGVPEPVARMNAQAFGLIAEGDADWTSEDVPGVLGRPARSFRDFAADHLAAFRR